MCRCPPIKLWKTGCSVISRFGQERRRSSSLYSRIGASPASQTLIHASRHAGQSTRSAIFFEPLSPPLLVADLGRHAKPTRNKWSDLNVGHEDVLLVSRPTGVITVSSRFVHKSGFTATENQAQYPVKHGWCGLVKTLSKLHGDK
jgi:hypothetical protein